MLGWRPRGHGGGGFGVAGFASARRLCGGRRISGCLGAVVAWRLLPAPSVSRWPWWTTACGRLPLLAPAGPWQRCAMVHGRRHGSWWTGRFRNVLGTAGGWREELAYRAWRPERRLRDLGVLMICLWLCGRQGMSPWRGRRPCCGGLCSSGVWTVFDIGGVVGLRTKVLPDSVGAGNGDARGRRFPPWRRCRGVLTHLRPSFRGENPNPAALD
jgi:hypothetical protein